MAPQQQQQQQAFTTPPPVDKNTKEDEPGGDALVVLQELADSYQRALEKRQISYMARYSSIRQSAVVSMAFMILFLVCGCAFLVSWGEGITIPESVLIAAYTLTSAGYGSVTIPKTNGFLLVFIVYIFVAISALAIMVRTSLYGVIHIQSLYCFL